MAKICPNCETENPSAFSFCGKCGFQLVEEEQLSEEDKLRKKNAELQEQLELLKRNKELKKELSLTKTEVQEIAKKNLVERNPIENKVAQKIALPQSFKKSHFLYWAIPITILLLILVYILLKPKAKEITTLNQIPIEITTPKEPKRDFPNEKKVKHFIADYHGALSNREYYRLDDFYTDNVEEFFAAKNVDGKTIKIRIEKYQEQTLKTISMRYDIDWSTYTQTKINDNDVYVRFVFDYYLNTKKFGNQKYTIQHELHLNSEYKIFKIKDTSLYRRYNRQCSKDEK
jgi:hypothetical protein